VSPAPLRGRAGLIGAAIGVLAAGAAVGFTAEKFAVGRIRLRRDPEADEKFGSLRGTVVPVVATDGTRLHVEIDEAPEAVDDLTVIFCHGFSHNQDAWHYQRRDLRGVARLVFWDQRSHGRSERGVVDPDVLEQLGRDLQSVIDATAPTGPLVLVGHSMGGMTIMSLAAEQPELFGTRVLGVGLISTSAGGLASVTLGFPNVGLVRRVVPSALSAMARQAELVERGRRAGSDIGFLITKKYSFGSDVPPSVVEFAAELISATPIDVIASFYPAFDTYDRFEALAVLSRGVELLVLVGDSDLLTPADHSRAIAAQLPSAELVVVPAAGHLVMIEHPDVVTSALVGLIGDVRRKLVAASA
jgi:pimeloyl-ACP methyl ester carboxylesterase